MSITSTYFICFRYCHRLTRPYPQASTPNAAAGNTNVGSSSAGAKFADAASTPGAKSAANATSSVKAGSASSGPGTSSIASHSSSIAVNSASSAATGNAQLQSAKPSGFGPSNGAAAQGPPYNTSAATSNVSLGANSSASTPTAGSSTTTPRSSFNAADGSRGATASTQSAAATGSGGNTSRSSKNNAAAQAIAGLFNRTAMYCDTCIREWRHLLTGPVYEVPLHLVQSSQKPVPGLRFVPSILIYFELIMLDASFGKAKACPCSYKPNRNKFTRCFRYRSITVQYLRECDINKILPTSFRRHYTSHLSPNSTSTCECHGCKRVLFHDLFAAHAWNSDTVSSTWLIFRR